MYLTETLISRFQIKKLVSHQTFKVIFSFTINSFYLLVIFPFSARCLEHSTFIWEELLKAQLAQEKQRQPKTWPKLWPSNVWSSTALMVWTTLLWANSSK